MTSQAYHRPTGLSSGPRRSRPSLAAAHQKEETAGTQAAEGALAQFGLHPVQRLEPLAQQRVVAAFGLSLLHRLVLQG
jgi:hypothetical protein